MRTLRKVLVGSLAVTFALLAAGVLDFCRVREDGSVEWAPALRTAAVRRVAGVVWRRGFGAVTGAREPEPQTAGIPRR